MVAKILTAKNIKLLRTGQELLQTRINTIETLLAPQTTVRVRVGDNWFEMHENDELVAKAMIEEFGKMNEKYADVIEKLVHCIKDADLLEIKERLYALENTPLNRLQRWLQKLFKK